MRLLHTSDWHLGQTLFDRSRYEEHEAFLSFLKETIEKECIDTLLISGDIFDTSVPSNSSKAQYYRFLASLQKTCCTDIVIIAGNHDSPSLLSAPADLLSALHIYVYSSSIGLEPLILKDKAIILPVPFLRDGEIRTSLAGESEKDKNSNIEKGIKKCYDELMAKALSLKLDLPIIAMGHLMVLSAKTDGETPSLLYIGGLGVVPSTIFSPALAYTALGHVHHSQALNKEGTIRYSGSPIPMGFGEADSPKYLIKVTFDEGKREITPLEIPTFRRLIQIKGAEEEILARIDRLKEEKADAWLSLVLTNTPTKDTLFQKSRERTKDSALEVLTSTNPDYRKTLASAFDDTKALNELTPREVFQQLLADRHIEGADTASYLGLFDQVMASLDKEKES